MEYRICGNEEDDEVEASPLAESFYAEVQRREQAALMSTMLQAEVEIGLDKLDNVDPIASLEDEFRRQICGATVEE